MQDPDSVIEGPRLFSAVSEMLLNTVCSAGWGWAAWLTATHMAVQSGRLGDGKDSMLQCVGWSPGGSLRPAEGLQRSDAGQEQAVESERSSGV